ncbi:MAG: citramalate synthase [Chloroflexota bacterium]|nr:citramalate synthase [Chloroflexota bacterium]
MKHVKIYDTTLRDGSQMEGISLTVEDKLKLARRLDELGIHYIEGGWPGSNPKDAEFFARAGELHLKTARLAAFGSTRRPHGSVESDPNLRLLIDAETPVVTLVGKASEMQVRVVLGCTLEENLAMVADSVAWCKRHGRETIYDAEHFFDGYRDNPDYALSCVRAAADAGADVVVLCDTNGGSTPEEIAAATEKVLREVRCEVGIHTHNDAELGVANTLAAVQKGATHVQGTINGYGERTGNANLCSILPNLELKYGYRTIGADKLEELTTVSRYFAEVANMAHDARLPYVGAKAFTHKAGLHVNAVSKAPETYEHLPPEKVGNTRRIMVSELGGRSNVLHKMRQFGLQTDGAGDHVRHVVEEVKRLENEGFQFEDAEASFELLVLRARPEYESPFRLLDFMVVSERRGGGDFLSEATVKLAVGDETMHTAADGDGPVNALDRAMRKALIPFYPQLGPVVLTDYKVRVLDNEAGTAATVRVWIQSGDGDTTWNTVGSSSNIIEASWLALADSLEYPLRRLSPRTTP